MNKFIGLLIFLVIMAILGGVGYGIYRLVKALGIKPQSKNTGEQCSIDIECKSNKCLFAKCL